MSFLLVFNQCALTKVIWRILINLVKSFGLLESTLGLIESGVMK